jgi:hypothetical protein
MKTLVLFCTILYIMQVLVYLPVLMSETFDSVPSYNEYLFCHVGQPARTKQISSMASGPGLTV